MKPVSPLCSLTLGGIVALAPACGPLPDDAPVMAQAAALHENQGTELAGTNRAGYAVLYSGARDAAGGAFSSLTVYRGALQAKQGGKVYSGDSAKLIGARLTAVDGSYVEIVRACPHPRTPQGWKPPSGWVPPTGCTYPVDWTVQPDEFEYELQVVSGGTRTPLCKGDWNRAVPMVGTFDKTGMRLTSATSFTFACNGGTAVKCSNWGYKPWVDPDRHLACTRMARADYCGDGASHTFEGTPVDVYDPAGILYPVTSAAYFEAAWTTKGALCLSKLRWQTLPPDGYCGAVLPDPRNGSGRFCDDISSDEMVRLGALSEDALKALFAAGSGNK